VQSPGTLATGWLGLGVVYLRCNLAVELDMGKAAQDTTQFCRSDCMQTEQGRHAQLQQKPESLEEEKNRGRFPKPPSNSQPAVTQIRLRIDVEKQAATF
jgi:hypothetical protein